MAFTAEPIPGEYYRDMELETDFVIVDVDEYEGLIDIRRAGEDDSVQITLDDWDEMLLEPADSPGQSLDMANQFSQDIDDIDDEDDDEDISDESYIEGE